MQDEQEGVQAAAQLAAAMCWGRKALCVQIQEDKEAFTERKRLKIGLKIIGLSLFNTFFFFFFEFEGIYLHVYEQTEPSQEFVVAVLMEG